MGHTATNLGSGLERLAIEAFEEQALIARHTREVVPLLVGIVSNSSSLTNIAGFEITMLNRDNILAAQRRSRCETKRETLNRVLVQWSPHIDDAITTLEKLLGLIGKVALNTLSNRLGSLVDVDARDGLAVLVGTRAANGVVKEVDAVGAGDVVEEELFDLWVVLGLDGVIVAEFRLDGVGDVKEHLEGVLVEVVRGLGAADVG